MSCNYVMFSCFGRVIIEKSINHFVMRQIRVDGDKL